VLDHKQPDWAIGHKTGRCVRLRHSSRAQAAPKMRLCTQPNMPVNVRLFPPDGYISLVRQLRLRLLAAAFGGESGVGEGGRGLVGMRRGRALASNPTFLHQLPAARWWRRLGGCLTNDSKANLPEHVGYVLLERLDFAPEGKRR
jgi:hypothetical protein